MNETFLDTAYPLALTVSDDSYHARALALAQRYSRSGAPIVTTQAVLLEIGNALSKTRYRSQAAALLKAFALNKQVTIVPLTEELFAKALALYEARPDKEWGLVDCVSFVVMRERDVTDALTSEEHYRQAGFLPLMREP